MMDVGQFSSMVAGDVEIIERFEFIDGGLSKNRRNSAGLHTNMQQDTTCEC